MPACYISAQRTHIVKHHNEAGRERINIDAGWRFMKYAGAADTLFYDIRPAIKNNNDNIVADTRAVLTQQSTEEHGLKKWMLPTANPLADSARAIYQNPDYS